MATFREVSGRRGRSVEVRTWLYELTNSRSRLNSLPMPEHESVAAATIYFLMEIGRRLRELRTARKLSQGDIQNRTGLLRCYTSRAENGMTVPSLQTLEKYARALEVPLYQLFYDIERSEEKPALPHLMPQSLFGVTEKERAELEAFAAALSKMDERDRQVLVALAQKLAGRTVYWRKQKETFR